MSAWGSLPNAAHIDAVIASVKAHTEIWEIWAETYDAAWQAPRQEARDAARTAIWGSPRVDAYGEAYDAARNAARNSLWDGTYSTVRGSILALVTYDDCSRYLDMTTEQLEVWARLSDEPAAVLLLPYLRVLEHIKQAECSGEHCSE